MRFGIVIGDLLLMFLLSVDAWAIGFVCCLGFVTGFCQLSVGFVGFA